MDRLFSALVLVPALASNACTVVADVDYRGAGDDSEAVDLDISGNVVFYREDYTDPGASYAGALDIELDVPLPVLIQFRTVIGDWFVEPQQICEAGEVVATQADTSPGLKRRLAQIVGASARLCVIDEGDPTIGDSLTFEPIFQGAPPPGQEAFLPSEILAKVVIKGKIPDVYQGTAVPPLVGGSVTLSSAEFRHQLFQMSGASQGTQLTLADGTLNGVLESAR